MHEVSILIKSMSNTSLDTLKKNLEGLKSVCYIQARKDTCMYVN